MTQIAQVKTLLAEGAAEVSVHRQSACGHDCDDCHLCLTIADRDITVAAENYSGARPGDTVLIESINKDVLGITVMIYVVPLLFFFIGYFLGLSISHSEGLSILMSGACFVVGFLPARMLDRRIKKKGSMNFRIKEIIKSGSNGYYGGSGCCG